MSQKVRWLWIGVVVLFILNIAVFFSLIPKPGKVLRVVYLNIGQGDAIYIEAPNGKQMLIDGGRDKKVISELSSVMSFFDRSIDVLMASHPDADHIAGLVDTLGRYRVGMVVEPGSDTDTQVYKKLEETISQKNIAHVAARTGQEIVLDEKNNIKVTILFPDQNVSSWETNASSIVARLTYGDNSFLFTGDSPIEIEDYLVAHQGGLLKSDVLKLGHHGSRTSTGDFYLSAVAPALAIISAGAGNSYGHPHQEVLDRLANHHIDYLSTIDNGRIEVVSDGKSLTVK